MSLNCKKVSWSDAYLVGNETIDAEHQKLFDLTEKLFNCNDNEKDILNLLKELIKYTKFHFAHEEQFMESINFKYKNEHKQLHKNIIKNLHTYIDKKETMSPKEFAQELALFVKNSIVEHILTEDKRVHHFQKDTTKLKDLFKWKETYKIKHDQIDQEHQKLFEIALSTLDTPKKEKKKHIRNVLLELTSYMKEHFQNEEQYMYYIEFPDSENHKKLHEDIIVKMNEFIKTLPQLSIEQFERKLIEYMDIWLINHIVAEDHKIICFMETKNQKA